MSYYDIDMILTDSQKVPCTFEITVPRLGYLEGNPGQSLKQGTKVELPLWMGSMLAVSQPAGSGALVTLDLPTVLGSRVLNALKADPRTIDLRAMATHYYSLGALMLELFDEDEVVEVMTDTFKKRTAEIADQAHNPRGALGDGAEFLRGLEENERQLFRAAHDGAKAVKTWMQDIRR